MRQLTLLKFLGRSASPLLVLRETAEVVLNELALALEMGPRAVVQARELAGDGVMITGTASGNQTILTVLLDPFAHRYVIDVISARVLTPSVVEEVLLDRFGPPGALVVDYLAPPPH